MRAGGALTHQARLKEVPVKDSAPYAVPRPVPTLAPGPGARVLLHRLLMLGAAVVALLLVIRFAAAAALHG